MDFKKCWIVFNEIMVLIIGYNWGGSFNEMYMVIICFLIIIWYVICFNIYIFCELKNLFLCYRLLDFGFMVYVFMLWCFFVYLLIDINKLLICFFVNFFLVFWI